MSNLRRGFTLPEAIVAFAITALALGLLMRSVAIGARGDAQAELTLAAVRLAQSRLAAAGTAEPLDPGETRGDDGGRLVWRVRIEALPSPGGAPEQVTAYSVRATVFARGDEAPALAELVTARLGPPPRQ
jgi:general secretion pathway protein I